MYHKRTWLTNGKTENLEARFICEFGIKKSIHYRF
jgi:hypothetical protein